mmetsp:Transcript_79851/g.226411  ORF Transcript_79851/g.226411 Transcript_79851/m.226411 type:complete len:274 (+) Transcript_79851:873-1694(+)
MRPPLRRCCQSSRSRPQRRRWTPSASCSREGWAETTARKSRRKPRPWRRLSPARQRVSACSSPRSTRCMRPSPCCSSAPTSPRPTRPRWPSPRCWPPHTQARRLDPPPRPAPGCRTLPRGRPSRRGSRWCGLPWAARPCWPELAAMPGSRSSHKAGDCTRKPPGVLSARASSGPLSSWPDGPASVYSRGPRLPREPFMMDSLAAGGRSRSSRAVSPSVPSSSLLFSCPFPLRPLHLPLAPSRGDAGDGRRSVSLCPCIGWYFSVQLLRGGEGL